MNNIVLTGGGTGGHVIPNICLIPHLKKHFKIYYIGTNGIEKELIKKESDITFKTINAFKINRETPLKNILIPVKLLKSIIQAKKILKEIKPKVVFSKGGYVSVPVCFAAKMLKIPIISHESDLSLGLANKIIYKLCTTFLTTFEVTSQKLKKAIYTGPPIREQLFCGNKERGYALTKLNKNNKTILFIGGSTGALSLNKIIFSALPELTKQYNVIHIVGKNKGNKSIKFNNYYQTEFVHNIEDIFAISDLVVSRAGSNAICELFALSKPMLLIPLCNKASRGDQVDNANYFKSLNIALVLNEQNLTKQTLLQNIELLNKKKNSLVEQMNSFKNKNGTNNIVKQILKYK